ncbi:PKD domain-containing protein [Patescibacteria group bacterium]|nr:PKD domain-containing protein [Patescibacteria group bacterium]MBU4162202.1 PKD domain-containing protein [Patescibacteria group bacterium]
MKKCAWLAVVLTALGLAVVLCSCEYIGNQAPIAMVNCDTTGIVAEWLCFDPTNSCDSDGTIVFYSWNFGDGSSSQSGTAIVAEHRYAEGDRTYHGLLTVTDDRGATASCPFTVSVEWEPCPNGESDGEADIDIYLIQGTDAAFLHDPTLFTVELDSEYIMDIVARDGQAGSSARSLGNRRFAIKSGQVLAETDGIAWIQVVVRKPSGEIITYDTRNQPGSKPLDLDHPRLSLKCDELEKTTITIYARDNDECGTQTVFCQTIQVGECPVC